MLRKADHDDDEEDLLLSTSSSKDLEQQSMISTFTQELFDVVGRVQHPLPPPTTTATTTTTVTTLPTFPESSCPESNPCLCVMDKMGHTIEELQICHDYHELPLIRPNCTRKKLNDDDGYNSTGGQKSYDDEIVVVVPRIYHSVSKSIQQDYHQIATTFANPTFVRNHHNDRSALTYIYNMCGEDIAKAYTCMMAPAFRADIFRFCALWSEGGIYLDSDLVPVVPLEELYSPCSHATIGHDFPWYGIPGKQMK